MTDEDKIVKKIHNDLIIQNIERETNYAIKCDFDFVYLDVDDVKVLLENYKKQSKEIEELKEDLKKKPIFLIKDIYSPKLKEINLQDVEGLIEQGREEVREEIKAKIEDILNSENSEAIEKLIEWQSLLEKE